ncbi:sodium/glycine symporter GlyP [Vibrio sp. JCM 19052]|nr:sodium/glycine symporter GlyP [Vibrio sp. JCM 19052]
MAIPNLIGLIALRHVVLEETKLFFKPSSQSDDFDAVKA